MTLLAFACRTFSRQHRETSATPRRSSHAVFLQVATAQHRRTATKWANLPANPAQTCVTMHCHGMSRRHRVATAPTYLGRSGSEQCSGPPLVRETARKSSQAPRIIEQNAGTGSLIPQEEFLSLYVDFPVPFSAFGDPRELLSQ